jgi:nudix-type nucleoside diphosphatase (YffH/AdpP family)
VTALFLHPPFDGRDVLARILGPEALPELRPATLAGHALRSDSEGLRVALVPDPDGAVAGGLAGVSAAARARLDFAFAALGAAPEPVDAGGRDVLAYRFDPADAPDARWSGEVDAEHRARLLESLTEVMGHYGRRDPVEMRRLFPNIAIRALARARGPLSRAPHAIGTGLGAADVTAIEREFSYARFFAMEEHRLTHRRFDGATSDVLDRAVFTSGDAVTIIPFDPRAGTVLMVEQFRAGPHARRDPHPWCLEPVAGRCDRSEPPEETARREALEEAGITLGRIERIGAFYPSPGIVAEFITAFVGEAELGEAGGVYGLPEEHEDIRAVVVPLDRAIAAIEAGEIRTAPLIISLYWLDRNAGRLSAAWT